MSYLFGPPYIEDAATAKRRKEERREQRRYEIARDVLASLWPTANFWVDVIAQEAVQAADALLKALEESSDGE